MLARSVEEANLVNDECRFSGWLVQSVAPTLLDVEEKQSHYAGQVVTTSGFQVGLKYHTITVIESTSVVLPSLTGHSITV